MAYASDPGGNFDSDAHRRVMAHLPNPDDDPITVVDLVADSINQDPHTLAHFENVDDVVQVLDDLYCDGYAKHLKGGWKNTPAGFDLLTGPPDESATTPTSATIGLDPAAISSNGDQ